VERRIKHDSCGKIEANARSIAVASELLAACKDLFDDWLTLVEQDLNDKDVTCLRIYNRIRAAVKNAEKQ